jgi:hypothetical protein
MPFGQRAFSLAAHSALLSGDNDYGGFDRRGKGI